MGMLSGRERFFEGHFEVPGNFVQGFLLKRLLRFHVFRWSHVLAENPRRIRIQPQQVNAWKCRI